MQDDRGAMAEGGGRVTTEEALELHSRGRAGKIEITPTKPLTTQRDLSLAYSPGVAAPCLAIRADPNKAYDYTAKGNLVAVVSNGTAVLGLGNLGALGSKPVMEGKAVLFKRFADIDGVDLEVASEDVDEVVNCVRLLAPTFGGINLEDIKAPECFIIEQRLRELMDIPVFHDDQHGTAIIATAALINALHLTGRELSTTRLVVNGAGAAGIACIELVKAMGMPHENVTLCDTKGVVYQGRHEGMNQWKSAHAIPTDARTLAEALRGADVAFGLSAKGAFTPEMVRSMAEKPIIFAMANPDPEITPEDAHAIRDDCIVATGRSDYPNQVNNVLGFPYIFRGALDVRASSINEAMKIAAADAIAALARDEVPDSVLSVYKGKRLRYGRDYLIPTPFDPRLITAIPPAVAQAAMETGVARKPIQSMERYRQELRSRLDPTASRLQLVIDRVRAQPKRVVFAEGEEERSISAAVAWRNGHLGTPILIGREDRVLRTMQAMGLERPDGIEVHNARLSEHNRKYADFLYQRAQRSGLLFRDCQRLVNQDRNVFAACMLATGHADAMITGLTRNYHDCLDDVCRVIDPKPSSRVFGMTMMVAARPHRVLRRHDGPRAARHPYTRRHRDPDRPAWWRAWATRRASPCSASRISATRRSARPRASATSWPSSTAVRSISSTTARWGADVALNPDLMALYPFCRLKGPANVLIMPALHTANISAKLLQELGGGTVIGPMLQGLAHSVQIVPLNATVSDILNIAAIAAHDAIGEDTMGEERAAAE